MDLKLDAKSLKLEELSKAAEELEQYDIKGAADVSASVKGEISNMKVRADISSQSVEIKGIGKNNESQGVAGIRHFRRFLCPQKYFPFLNGANISASGSIDQTDATPILSFSGAIKNASLTKFHDTLEFLKTMDISGDASGSWSLRGKADSPELILKVSRKGQV